MSLHRSTRALAALIAGLGCVALAAAQSTSGYDTTTLSAADVLPSDVLSGPGYRISDTVTSDGHLNTYQLDTDWGPLTIQGTDLLMLRIHEMAAIKQIEQTKQSSTFLDAAATAAKSPINGAKNLVTDPVNTVDQTVKGAGKFIGNLGDSLFGDHSSSNEDTFQAAIGFNAYKRKVAYQLGVDPYTTYPPLEKELNDVCWTGFAGGMAVKAAFMAVPGGAGLAVSSTSTTEDMRAQLRDNTPADLVKLNTQKLQAMGVSSGVIGVFMRNTTFTPTLQTGIVDALAKMSGTEQRTLIIEDAASVTSHDDAFYQLQSARLLAGYHVNVEPVTRLVQANHLTMAQNQKGALVGVFAVDRVLWTPSLERGEGRASAYANTLGNVTSRELWVPRGMTALAKQNLTKAGWTVHDDAKKQLSLK